MIQRGLDVHFVGLIRFGECDPTRSDRRQQRAVDQSEQTREGLRIMPAFACRLFQVFDQHTLTIAPTRQVRVKVRAPRVKVS
jgi:hypothetical protein